MTLVDGLWSAATQHSRRVAHHPFAFEGGWPLGCHFSRKAEDPDAQSGKPSGLFLLPIPLDCRSLCSLDFSLVDPAGYLVPSPFRSGDSCGTLDY